MTLRDHIHVEFWESKKDNRIRQSHIARDEREAQGFLRVGRADGFFPVMRPCNSASCAIPEDD